MLLQLNTKTKIAIARLAYLGIMAIRRLLGLDEQVETTRSGVRWHLDLREGIDLSIYLFGQFEPETVRAYTGIVKPGSVVLDIGANIGAHALLLARAVAPEGRVYAFEPTCYAFQKLTTNIALNSSLGSLIRAEQAMLVDDTGAALPQKIYSSWPLTTATETQHPKHLGIGMDTQGARTITLDDYLDSQRIRRVDFIKLDVDGNECAVLRGATRTLRQYKPVLLMEMMPYGLTEAGTSLDELLGILRSADYSLYTLRGVPLPNDATLTDHIPSAGSINVICRAS